MRNHYFVPSYPDLNHVLVSTIVWSICIIEHYDFKCNKWLVCTLTKLWKESKEKCLYMHKISLIIHPTIFQFQVDAMLSFFLFKNLVLRAHKLKTYMHGCMKLCTCDGLRNQNLIDDTQDLIKKLHILVYHTRKSENPLYIQVKSKSKSLHVTLLGLYQNISIYIWRC